MVPNAHRKEYSSCYQGLGRCFSTTDIRGYYNDLTEKVTRLPELLDNNELPYVEGERGEQILFPVAVFQYGLGAYDLYLLEQDERYLKKFFSVWIGRYKTTKVLAHGIIFSLSILRRRMARCVRGKEPLY